VVVNIQGNVARDCHTAGGGAGIAGLKFDHVSIIIFRPSRFRPDDDLTPDWSMCIPLLLEQ